MPDEVRQTGLRADVICCSGGRFAVAAAFWTFAIFMLKRDMAQHKVPSQLKLIQG